MGNAGCVAEKRGNVAETELSNKETKSKIFIKYYSSQENDGRFEH